MKHLPNLISVSRGIAAVAMLFTTVFSLPFWALYAWCGISDMVDGPLARKLGAESRRGAAIDSVADLVFLVAAVIKVVPVLSFPSWIWWVVGAVACLQVVRMTCLYFWRGGFAALHDKANKVIGVALFFAPVIYVAVSNNY